MLFALMFTWLTAFPATAAIRCSRSHIEGLPTPLSEILASRSTDVTRNSEVVNDFKKSENHETVKRIFLAWSPMVQVNRAAMKDVNATVGEYFRANLLAKERLKESLEKIATSSEGTDLLRRTIKKQMSSFSTTESGIFKIEQFLKSNSHRPLRDFDGNQEFEALVGSLTAGLSGAIGQFLVTGLVNPIGTNQSLKSITQDRAILFRAGFANNQIRREVDLIEKLSDGTMVWGEIKFGGGRLTSSGYRTRSIVKQAGEIQEIVERLKLVGFPLHHRVYLLFEKVEPEAIRPLVRMGVEVVHINIWEEFK